MTTTDTTQRTEIEVRIDEILDYHETYEDFTDLLRDRTGETLELPVEGQLGEEPPAERWETFVLDEYEVTGGQDNTVVFGVTYHFAEPSEPPARPKVDRYKVNDALTALIADTGAQPLTDGTLNDLTHILADLLDRDLQLTDLRPRQPGELFTITFTVEDVLGIAADNDVDPTEAVERALEWSKQLVETAVSLVNTQLESIILTGQP